TSSRTANSRLVRARTAWSTCASPRSRITSVVIPRRPPNCRRLAAMSELRLWALSAELVDAIRPWFDDPETTKYLGGRGWPDQALRLAEEFASGTSTDANVVARHSWVALDGDEPVGLLGVEAYADHTASLSVLVRPTRRRMAYGIRVIEEAIGWAAAAGVTRIAAG